MDEHEIISISNYELHPSAEKKQHIRTIILKLPMFHYLWAEVVHQNCWNGHTHVFIDCYHHQKHYHHHHHPQQLKYQTLKTWCNSTMLYAVITLVKNVPRQHHCSYLKFYCSHMSIFLQQTIGRSDVRGQFLFSPYRFFSFMRSFSRQMSKVMRNIPL